MKKSNKRNQNNSSLNLNKKSVSKLNQEIVNGGRAASNISANLTQCLSDATHCHQCERKQ
jgi:hypothetical protein